jgi:large subunit ribosomal protein L4e
MAKLQVLDINGNKAKEITSEIFDGDIRQDVIQKIVEAEKEMQPYAPFYKAGMQTSASGNVHHNRHVWKTDRGKGMSRYPKKRMSDKGERFVWVAAAIPGVRKGRRAHPPKILRAELKINQKEMQLGFLSALALISSVEMVKIKYDGLKSKEIKVKLPLIVDAKMLSLKTAEFFSSLKKIIGEDLFDIAIQESSIRAGRGKMRNRKYKKNAGLLLVTANNESIKISGIDVKKVKDIKIADFASNGARLVMFTENSIKDLENKIK